MDNNSERKWREGHILTLFISKDSYELRLFSTFAETNRKTNRNLKFGNETDIYKILVGFSHSFDSISFVINAIFPFYLWLGLASEIPYVNSFCFNFSSVVYCITSIMDYSF